jgi:hypothetical protein
MRKKVQANQSMPPTPPPQVTPEQLQTIQGHVNTVYNCNTSELNWTSEFIKPLFHHYGKDVLHLIHIEHCDDIKSMFTVHGNKIVSKFTHEFVTKGNYLSRFPGAKQIHKGFKDKFGMIVIVNNDEWVMPSFFSKSDVAESYGFTNTIMVPVHKAGRYCNQCGRNGEFQCPCCMSVWYCSERCQRKDEHKHFDVADKISEVPPNQLTILIRSINSLKDTKAEYVPRPHPDPKLHEMLQWIQVVVSAMNAKLQHSYISFRFENETDVNTFKFYGNQMRLNCDVGATTAKNTIHMEIYEDENGNFCERETNGIPGQTLVSVSTPDKVLYMGPISCLQISPKLSCVKARYPGKACNFCGVEGASKKCSCCGSIYYCSRECQKSDWQDHKASTRLADKDHTGLVICLRIRVDP